MPDTSPITSVAHTIQLAVAPVFLLTALGTILGVLSTRLGRIVDRSRVLRERINGMPRDSQVSVAKELRRLSRRRKLANRAITSCTVAALLVCLMIALLFVGSIVTVDMSKTIAGMFIAAILAFTAGLVYFLREVLVAVSNYRHDSDH